MIERWKNLNPWQSLLLSFAGLIALGTGMLLLPAVQHTGGLGPTDAVFESASAVCVTGLATVPTSGFNIWGQLVLLFLMQLGGIGIMTFTTTFMMALRGKLRLKDRLKISALTEGNEWHDRRNILPDILKITFVAEGIGFILLSIGFRMAGQDWGSALYNGMFHSVSAFCNAGFSTFDTSLTGFNPLIKYTVAALIVTGGIGYFVIFELMRYRRRHHLSLHTRVVLLSTTGLIVLGALLLYVFEGGRMSLTDSIFQSVTARTAGFNTVDIARLHYPSVFLLLLLMFIGASPGSTGGGIKTTHFFVMMYSIVSVLKGRTEVVFHYRRIGYRTIIRSFATAIIYFAVIFLGTLLLLQDTSLGLKDALFEAVSAMGTVGLSLGITPHLGVGGKWIIIALMYIGRVGPASFAMATLMHGKETKIKYPEGIIF